MENDISLMFWHTLGCYWVHFGLGNSEQPKNCCDARVFFYSQPERSKREDLHHKNCNPYIKHKCDHRNIKSHIDNCEYGGDCDFIYGVRMRCSEH